ncbi:hypothetical protein [Amycolatopsis sp. GM8]|uniref:hypothetical protein n=1 Tax=Amycolatopsis sp. GM8 TaxID=2896530 RepID=UPI001F2DD84D|nr:hypothetical protein [Amycolatopsis sp. GM8]
MRHDPGQTTGGVARCTEDRRIGVSRDLAQNRPPADVADGQLLGEYLDEPWDPW